MEQNTHHRRQWRNGFLLTGFVFLAAMVLSFKADATHFRGGNLFWQQAGGTTIQFTLNTSWRRQYFIDFTASSTNVGTTVPLGSVLDFGDGSNSGFIDATVTSSDATADIITTTYTVSHTYSNLTLPANYNASFDGCCRLS